jgi:hypothetical protein
VSIEEWKFTEFIEVEEKLQYGIKDLDKSIPLKSVESRLALGRYVLEKDVLDLILANDNESILR